MKRHKARLESKKVVDKSKGVEKGKGSKGAEAAKIQRGKLLLKRRCLLPKIQRQNLLWKNYP